MIRTTTLLSGFLSIAILAFALAVPKEAVAQPDVAPFAGYCFGDGTSTCLAPEISLNVTRLRLNGPEAGKVDVGIPVGAGYALLFGYDQWWASGPAIHGFVDFSQAVPNRFEISGMVTLLRYGHLGIAYSRLDSENLVSGQLGLTLPIDVVTTAVADRRAKAVRAARAAAPPVNEAGG